jgi:tRNA(adenine34) deaminase
MHEQFMQEALQLAQKAMTLDEVPVGAIVVLDNEIIGRGYNCPIVTSDPTAHAEIIALRDAAKRLNNYRLIDADLYVTLEPCAMCVGAMVHARVKHCFFGAYDSKTGMAGSVTNLWLNSAFNHKVESIGGVLADQSRALIQNFFKTKRR